MKLNSIFIEFFSLKNKKIIPYLIEDIRLLKVRKNISLREGLYNIGINELN